MNLVDLDDAVGLQRAIDELQRVHDLRNADPELWADIQRVINEGVSSGRISDENATRLSRELDEVAPATMLEANFKTLIPNRKTIGSYRGALPRCSRGASIPFDWLAADPRRLAGVITEMFTHTSDVRGVVGAVLKLSADCGIENDIADVIISAEVRRVIR
ncbi:MAG TPA: hypothetical protein VMU99_09565 [Acidimicrobiales bacterium]|nr:hypothetical protein [Acidimicrobiales bacterium]